MSYSVSRISAELSQSTEVTISQAIEFVYQGISHANSKSDEDSLQVVLQELEVADKNTIIPDGLAKLLLGDLFVASKQETRSSGGMGGDIAKVESLAHAHLAQIPQMIIEKLELARERELARVTAEKKSLAVETFLHGEMVLNETSTILEGASFELKMSQVEAMATESRKRASALFSSLYGQVDQLKSDVAQAKAVGDKVDADVQDMKGSIAELLKQYAPESNLIDILSKKKTA